MVGDVVLFTGDKVRIDFNPKDISVVPGMMKYNGQVAKIARRNGVTSKTSTYYYYQLEDVVSDSGIPFNFTKDMLTFISRGW